MPNKKPIMQLLTLPETEHIRIKDCPTNIEDQNIELRHEINMAFEQIQRNHAHRFNNMIHAVCNQYGELQGQVDEIQEANKVILEKIKSISSADVKTITEDSITATLVALGLDDKDAVHDVHSLRSFIQNLSATKSKIWFSIVAFLTVAACTYIVKGG